ncbi:hypothetical protein PR003_g11174 [Phytophthora rubi]|uniref:Transmembrane protein n=2 Tax=Phytophthora TaxID=4783 RepID=A0A6A4FP16_9STRA|nr:hypothetical protein PR001_g10714 [Phytophthora rubi]KAE9339122.1 hypothetical protein PR003_g11174 [Phytophthora rubi]
MFITFLTLLNQSLPPQNGSSLIGMWEATQVELQGTYSTGRVIDLAKYIRSANSVRVVAVIIGTPVPCLLVTLIIDFMPLFDPSKGIEANKLFLVREFYGFTVMTLLAIHQFRTGVRTVLSYPTKRVIRDALIVAALTVGGLYGAILWIGFPLPFTTLLVVPVWLTLTVIPMGIQWAKDLLENPKAVAMLIDMVKLWLCDFLLVFIYPPYFYVFTTLTHTAQMAFALLLPLIKLFMRNLFARAVAHLGDETPGLVIFNADVFGSLFIAYCMQSSPSIWTTMELMVVAVCLMGLSLRDIEHARKGLGELERKVDSGYMWSSYHGAVGHISLGGRLPTTLERASILLERETQSPANNSRSSQLLELKRMILDDEQEREGPTLVTKITKKSSVGHDILRMFGSSARIHPDAEQSGKKVEEDTRSTGSRTLGVQDRLKYTRKVRRLLYMAEFLLLLNYVEVVIPLIFSIYLVITYYLPNREYYAIYDGIDQIQLMQTLTNVLFYCLLQLASFLLLVFMLRRMLGFSPIQQIAFILKKQVDYVQMCLIFWLYYNVQSSLRHLGYDYSFQFIWLSNSGSTSGNGSS